MKAIVDQDTTHMNESEAWIHFKTPDDLVYSLRRYDDQYLDTNDYLNIEGDGVSFPEKLKDAAKRAEVICRTNPTRNEVRIEMPQGVLRLTGQGDGGWYKEQLPTDYTGKDIKFDISTLAIMRMLNHSGTYYRLVIEKDGKQLATYIERLD